MQKHLKHKIHNRHWIWNLKSQCRALILSKYITEFWKFDQKESAVKPSVINLFRLLKFLISKECQMKDKCFFFLHSKTSQSGNSLFIVFIKPLILMEVIGLEDVISNFENLINMKDLRSPELWIISFQSLSVWKF